MNTIETLMDNPEWDAYTFFFIRIEKDYDKDMFKATLYLDPSPEGELHTFFQSQAITILQALSLLEQGVQSTITEHAAEHFLQKSLETEEEEKNA